MKSTKSVLTRLRENPGANLRAIEDLAKFPDRTQIFAVHEDDPKRFAYLMISGHPSTWGGSPTVIMGGCADFALELAEHLPKVPYTIVETPAEFAKVLAAKLPGNCEIYHERRMELRRASFTPAADSKRVRRLVEADDVALAEFHGAPPQAAAGMRQWINGAKALLGIFDGNKLVSMGSTFCAVPEGWSLVSIKTREDFRRQGLAAEVTSALCKNAFEGVDTVELTVLSENKPAIALYEKLGFELQEKRVWIDCGSGSKPFF